MTTNHVKQPSQYPEWGHLFYFFGILTFLFISGCKDDTAEAVENAAIAVRIVTLNQATEKGILSYPAELESERKVTFSTKVMGKVLYLPHEVGSAVQQGQVLIKIDASDIEAKKAQTVSNSLEAKSYLKNVETNYSRIKALFDKGSATQKELDDIATALESARSKVNTIEAMQTELNDYLSYSTIISPLKGSVTQKFVQVGDMASPAMPLLSVEGGGVTKATAKVSESDIAFFSTGLEAELAVDALGGEVFKGTVEQVSQTGSSGSRQYEVKLRLKTPGDKRLKSGMFSTLLLKAGDIKGVLIADSLIIRRGDLEGVYVLSQNQEALLRWVRLGKKYGNSYEVISGIRPGEKIIVQAEGRLMDGKKVEVKE